MLYAEDVSMTDVFPGPEQDLEADTALSAVVDAVAVEGNKQTAEAARRWLIEAKAGRGYRAVSDRGERVRIAQAFAARNKVVYGQAFDLVRVQPGADVDFGDLTALSQAIEHNRIILIEVKATKKARGAHFREHFFSISTAELLVAQSLGDLYRFAFVNTSQEECFEVSLRQIYARTKAIYPTWSIRLDDQTFPPETSVS
jgi:hypothetical protein